MSNSGTKARTQRSRQVPNAGRAGKEGWKAACSMKLTPGKADQESGQAETAAGETPVAAGSHRKANIKANFSKCLYYSS